MKVEVVSLIENGGTKVSIRQRNTKYEAKFVFIFKRRVIKSKQIINITKG